MRVLQLLALLITASLCTLGCDHEEEPFDGPSLVDRFGEFRLVDSLMANRTTVDFSAGETVIFSAAFNKNVNWVIEITGMESGAVKRIEGFDRELTAANALWQGGTTELPFFSAETCLVELRIPEEPGFLNTLEIEALSTRTYEGELVIDFEQPAGSDIEFGNFEFELSSNAGRQNDIPAAQGEWYYLLEGTDDVVTNFFVGLINISAGIQDNTYFSLPTTVPEELFFNAFLYHDGSPHTIAVIQFVFDSNESGAFEDGQDATFQIEGDFPLNHQGWIAINHPMSEVDMTQAQLEKLVTIRVLLISDNNSQPSPPLPVRFGIDYITFTQGGPLEL